MAIMKAEPVRMSDEAAQGLIDTFHRHTSLMSRVRARFVPKHHLWAHLVQCAAANGNPRFYSTFLDETLNGVVATMAKAGHSKTWERSIFTRLQLVPLFNGGKYVASVHGGV
eukprot:2081175-Pyramimonas_sp.AAC.1